MPLLSATLVPLSRCGGHAALHEAYDLGERSYVVESRV